MGFERSFRQQIAGGPGVAYATELGFNGVTDAPLALAAGEFLFGSRFVAGSDLPWATEVFDKRRTPRETVSMLKFRIA